LYCIVFFLSLVEKLSYVNSKTLDLVRKNGVSNLSEKEIFSFTLKIIFEGVLLFNN